MVVAGWQGKAVGFDSRTGGRLWTVSGLPSNPELGLRHGRVLVTSAVQGGTAPTAVTAIDPRAGRVAWRFDPGATVSVLGAGAGGIVMSTYNTDRVYLIAAATGKVRWQVAGYAAMDTRPVVTATDVIVLEGRTSAAVVDRRVADGSVRWSAPTGAQMADSQPLATDGTDVIVAPWLGGTRTVSPVIAYRLNSGITHWRVSMPSLVQMAAVTAGPDLLVQASDPASACPAVGLAVGSAVGG